MKLMATRPTVNNAKRLIVLMAFFLTTLIGRGQAIDWSTTRNWKIYALNNKEAYFYPVDTLVNFKSASMNDSTVLSFLSKASILPKNKGATWMGVYIASYETEDKQRRKLILSSYGGFFFDSYTQRYYGLPKELRKDWNDFVVKNLEKVFEE